MTEVVICGYARSAFTPAKKGQLSKTRPDDLAARRRSNDLLTYEPDCARVYD